MTTTDVEGDEAILQRLKMIAWERSNPFCYSDYRTVTPAENGFCAKCGSDDLMRELPGNGVEYGISWVMEAIVREDWDEIPVSVLKENAVDAIDETHPVLRIGSSTFYPSTVLQQLDSLSFDEWVDGERERLIEDCIAVQIDGRLYRVPDQW